MSGHHHVPPAGCLPQRYYAWRSREPSPRAAANRRLLERIRAIHMVSREHYGSPNIHAELAEKGWRVKTAIARLLVVCYEFPPLGGGGAKVVAGLARQLRDKALSIDLVTMSYRGLKPTEHVGNLTIHRASCIRVSKSVCHAIEMIPYVVTGFLLAYRLHKKNRYSLNHTHFILPDGLISLLLNRLTGLPYIITAHGSDVPGYNPDRFVLLHRLLRPLWRRIVSHAEYIVCPSQTIQDLVLRALPDAKTTIIPNAIEPDRFRSDLEKEPKVLVVTRMFQRKGVQYFLQALRGIDTDFDIHIVGDGPYLGTLKQMAVSHDLQATFHGSLDNRGPELRELFETSRIFVFTSEAENFPVVLLEAMVAGMAIITTGGTGCEEVVGDTGIVVTVRCADAIRENLLRLMEDENLCRRLGLAARRRALAHFTWRTVAAKYLDVYEHVARGCADGNEGVSSGDCFSSHLSAASLEYPRDGMMRRLEAHQ